MVTECPLARSFKFAGLGTNLANQASVSQTRRPLALRPIGITSKRGLARCSERPSSRAAPGSGPQRIVRLPPSPPAPFTFQPHAPLDAATLIAVSASAETRPG